MSMSSMAASETNSSSNMPENLRTGGAGPGSDEDITRPEIPPRVAPGVPVPIIELGDRIPALEPDDPAEYISNLPGPLWSRAPRQISRAVSPGLPPHLSSIRRAQEEVSGHWFDQQAIKQPPPPKTAEQMTVNFECKICFEQISSIVFLPCRKRDSLRASVNGFLVDEVCT